MSKRLSDQSNPDPKKAKLDDFDDSWGEDFDANLIDDCFQKATQVSGSNVTLMTSYTCFKDRQSVVTSTQYGQSTSENFKRNDPDLQTQLQQLQQKYREREGEVSILRMNLENLKKEVFTDQRKKENEWKEKLNDTEKEVLALKSELQLKKLEIANLKQQQMELSRLPNIEENLTQKIQYTPSKSVKVVNGERSAPALDFSHKIYINSKTANLFNMLNFSFTTEDLLLDKHKDPTLSSVLDRKDSIRRELLCLTDQTLEDVNENIKHIDKIVHDSFCILQVLQNSLQEVEVLHQKVRLNKIGLICSEILILLRNLFPFSSYLRKCLLYDEECHFHSDMKHETSFLNLLLEILSLIIKKGNFLDFHQFAITVLNFFSTIFSTGSVEPREDIVELTLSIASNYDTKKSLIYEASVFLNIVTRNSTVVTVLCSKQNRENNENCKFLEYIKSAEAVLEKDKEDDMFQKIQSTFLGLMYNIFRTNNNWVQQENKPCDCLRKLTVLVIGIIYKTVNDPSFYRNSKIFNVLMKVLNLLTSNAYDLMQKYVSDYANFKEIIYKMLHLGIDTDSVNMKKLENLSLTEDFVEIPKERFSKAHLMLNYKVLQ